MGTHSASEHTHRNRKTHLGSQSSGVLSPAGRHGCARVHSDAHSATLTDAVTYVMHMENPSPSQGPLRPPHISPPPASG